MIVVGRPRVGGTNRATQNLGKGESEGNQRRWFEKAMRNGGTPTPADEDVPPKVFLLEDEGESQQSLQVHALHQQPEVVGQDAELEEGHG